MGAEIFDVFGEFLPQNQFSKIRRNALRIVFGNHQGSDSDSSTLMPLWAGGDFRPVKIRVISGKTEFLLGVGIIKKLRMTVDFGANDTMLGRGMGRYDF